MVSEFSIAKRARRTRQRSCSCTGFHLPRASSIRSSRCLLHDIMWSHRTSQASATATPRQHRPMPTSRRILSACGRLSFRMPMPTEKGWTPSGAALRNIGPIRKRIRKCSIHSYHSQQPNNVTHSARRIPSVTIRIPGRTNMFTCRNRANTRSRPLCCTTTAQTSLHAQRGKHGCASTGRRFWWSGGGTIPRSSLPVRRRRDLPDAEIHLLDAGHFALDEKNDDIASLVLAFLAEHSSTCRVATLARL